MSYALNQYSGFATPASLVPPATLEWYFARDNDLTDTSGTRTFTHTRTDINSRASYWDSSGVLQTAAASVPRWNHHPITNTPLGLMHEPQGINSHNYSQQLNNAAAWSATAMGVSANQADFIDGNTVAEQLTPTAVSTDHYLESNSGITTTVGNHSMQGIYVKGVVGEIMNCMVYFQFGTGLITKIWVDLSDGSIGDTSGTMESHGVEALPDDWYFVWARGIQAGNTSVRLRIYASSGTTSGDETWAPNGTDKFYACGTNGQTNIRNIAHYRGPVTSGDNIQGETSTVLATSPWFSATAGTIVIDYFQYAWQAQWTTYLATLRVTGGATWTDYIGLYANSNTDDIHALMTVSSVQQFNAGITKTTFGVDNYHKAAFAWELNNSQLAADGDVSAVDTSCTIPTGLAEIALGHSWVPAVQRTGNNIQRVRYWSWRLSEAELKILTSL